MACLYRRRKKFWISYYLNGGLVQKSLHTANERVALSKKRQIEYDLALGDLHVASKLNLPFVLEEFCSHLKRNRTYKSYKNDFSRLRIFFGPICESLKICPPGAKDRVPGKKPMADKYSGIHVQAELLEDITPEIINRFLSAREKQNNWSPKTCNLLRQVLHRLFSYAIKHHGFRARDRRYPNPAAGVERRREPAPQITFLSLQQIIEQLKALENHPLIHAMVATYIFAGIRREEALWLTHEDVDLDKRVIRVQAKTIANEFWQPKTKRNRVIPISDALLAILKDYTSPFEGPWFFPSPTGKRWNPDNFSQDLKEINDTQGLAWTCLDFRHTFGSHLAQKGESLYKIATLMGNSPEICRRHYAALIPEAMRETVEFVSKEQKEEGGDTKLLLREILRELRKEKDPEKVKPILRLVRDG